jgi:hypothetical protein
MKIFERVTTHHVLFLMCKQNKGMHVFIKWKGRYDNFIFVKLKHGHRLLFIIDILFFVDMYFKGNFPQMLNWIQRKHPFLKIILKGVNHFFKLLGLRSTMCEEFSNEDG